MKNNIIQYLQELIENKKKLVTTDADKEKIFVIEQLLNDNGSFFKISMDSALGILKYLGVSEEESQQIYFDLISVDNYKNMENIRFTISNKM